MAATKTQKKYFYATGRRKTSTARAFIQPGAGEVTINGRKAEDYLTIPSARVHALEPLKSAEEKGAFECRITVSGGGPSGQAGAIRHALARALVNFDEDLHIPFKKAGYLTRDARAVERKKYGLHGARKRPQFSKR